MDEADVETQPFRAALLVHEARHVGRNDVLGPRVVMVGDLVVSHLGRDRLLENGECAAEPAAFIRPSRGHELDALHLAEQIDRLREERLVDLRCLGGAQLA